MKTSAFVLACLFATSNAVQIKSGESPDCPTPPEVFSFRDHKSASAAGLAQISGPGVSPDCPEATSAAKKGDRLHPACFPNMAQKGESPDCPTPPEVFSYREGSAASAAGLAQISGPGVSPDCPEATSAAKKGDRLHPACFPNMAQKGESPDCPTPPEVFSYREGSAASAAGLVQLQNNFASGMAGDEDLGQDIIMKGDKFHYNQRLAEESKDGAIPWRGYPGVAEPATKWKAYNDAYPAAEEPAPIPMEDLPLCRGYRSGQIAGVNCRIFVTSTPPGTHNTLVQLEDPIVHHANAAHVNTGILPTCTGADSDVPETNCTNRAAPICNDAGTNGVPNVSCTPKLPVCNGLPGTNGHSGVDCIAPAKPACGLTFGGQAGVDCTPVAKQKQNWHFAQSDVIEQCNGANAGHCVDATNIQLRAEEIVQYYSPTCSETVTTNCQPVCNEALTRGCTESRTPTPTPRDRFEGRKTF